MEVNEMNTSENKLKFFALHHGQEFYTNNSEGRVNYALFQQWEYYSDKCRLPLKSIRFATDEEFRNDTYLEMGLGEWHDGEDEFLDYPKEDTVYIESTDRLRSLGYALPYMGIPINKMVEFGWIEIINEQ